ncbi:hypothetical protein J7K92_02270 [bacterium]|nr:hypothetical protein [bacterium]
MFFRKTEKTFFSKQKIRKSLVWIIYCIARHDFLVFVLLSTLITGFICLYLWHYIEIVEKENKSVIVPMVKINEKEYNKFLEYSSKRQEEFWKAEQEKYKEVFTPLPSQSLD